MENFEFGDVKKLRKSLLIASIVGIFLVKLIKYSTGSFEFLGFNIPIREAEFLAHFVGYIIIFFLVALLIRFGNEEFTKSYREKWKNATGDINVYVDTPDSAAKKKVENETKNTRIFFRIMVLALDIIFPIILALLSISYIFWCSKNVT
ncbi:hypothetical protein ACFSQJ_11525 [Croceitalea marina]|uniref:DUF3899 domain-containing protein n=1 Tax=Croceitalea marina TaxID=1775166 RepID=A0ABW5MWR3_9FLAO